MTSQHDQMRQIMGKIIATAWHDITFKSRLLSNPRSVLSEVGLIPPPHLEIHVVENTPQITHMTLPAPWADTSDPVFMDRLQQNPRSVLSEKGISIPDNMEIVFLENTNTRMNIVVPTAPSNEEISIEKI